MNVAKIRAELRRHASKERAIQSTRFFKTGVGEYGYGDRFIGVTVPDTRKVARLFQDAPLSVLKTLLESAIHEERLLALLILIAQYERGVAAEQKRIYRFYLENITRVNNWDLVDTSAAKIVGSHLLTHPVEKKLLMKLARSLNIWERRIAVIATFAFIQAGSSGELFMLAEKLLADPHDLMHKAIGWMLREVGKRIGREEEKRFLDEYADRMPRTALRYALEHFSEKERKYYMQKNTSLR